MKKKNRWLFLFLAPYVIGACVFIISPLFYSLYLSFTSRSLFGGGQFVGLGNYGYLFSDEIFRSSLVNTAYYAVLVVPSEISIALLIALVLHKETFKGGTFFRAVIFMPFVLSLISIGLVWSWLLSPGFGFLSQIADLLNLEFPSVLTDARYAMIGVAVATLWRNVGYYTTIFIAGLQSVPDELFDAAKVDGANGLQKFWNVTFPMMSSMVFFCLVIATIWAWQVFDLTYTMTKGGPARSTLSTGLLIYNTAFIDNQVGRASAQSWVLLIVILTLTGLYFLGQKKWVYYEND